MITDFFHHLASRSRPGSAGRPRAARGQSLVEFALTLPMLLLLVAGTVEVTNLLTLYNEVTLATREGARHAAQGGPDPGVRDVITNSLLGTPIDTSPERLNIWIVRPMMYIWNCSPNCAWVWKNGVDDFSGNQTTWGASSPEQCIYPEDGSCITKLGSNPVDPLMVGGRLASAKNASLLDDPNDILGGGEVFNRLVVLAVRYDAQTILNFRMFGFNNGRIPLYSYVVMRQEVASSSANQLAGGCSAYPIALDAREIGEPSENQDIPLLRGATGGFTFLSWDKADTSVGTLKNALTAPGVQSKDGSYNEPVPPAASPGHNTELRRTYWVYTNTTPPNNTQLWQTVPPGTAQVLNNWAAIQGSMVPAMQPRAMRVIVFETDPSNNAYQISGFAVIRIISVAGTTLNIRWVSWDYSCGFPTSG